MDPANHNKRFSLTSKDPGRPGIDFDEPILVGREPSVVKDGKQLAINLIVNDPMVSGLHARISPDEQGLLVEDLNSRNGTFVNDQRVTKPTPGRHGDEVRFDNVIFTIADRRPPAKREKVGTAAAETQGTKVRQSAADIEPGGKRGGTVMLPANRDLPKGWADKPGTVAIPGDVLAKRTKRTAAEDFQRQVREPTFLILSGSAAGSPIVLKVDGEFNFWNIGKDPNQNELDIVLDDDSVSGLHAKIVRREGRWKIIDLASTNGMLINDQRRNPAVLKSGDRISIGTVDCVFLLPQGHSGAAVTKVTKILGHWPWRWALATLLLILVLCVAWLTYVR